MIANWTIYILLYDVEVYFFKSMHKYNDYRIFMAILCAILACIMLVQYFGCLRFIIVKS